MGNADEKPGSEAAVLFADICESSRLYAERGDRIAFEIASQCLDLLAEATRAFGGQPVKRLGDGLLSTFDTAAAALRAAASMLLAVEAPPWGADPRVRVHIGVGHGGVVFDRSDVHGDVVNVAARLAELAQADEIFLSGEAFNRLPPEMQMSTRRIDERGLRNRPGEVQVYQYMPTARSGDETIRSATPWHRNEARLELVYGSAVVTVGPECARVRLGRGPDNDMAISGTLVSRHHAEISFQHGGFVLRDFSTNGTYVLADDGSPVVRVFRAERALSGNGAVALGGENGESVRFRLVD